MRIDTKLKNTILTLVGICLLRLSPIFAQNNPTLSINPYLQNDSLKLEISYQNLFTGNIKKTLLAGLPILMEINLKLLDTGDKTIQIKTINGKISYDVWEELFNIQGLQSTQKSLHTLEDVKNYFSRKLKPGLLPKEYLMRAEEYRIDVESHLTLLTRKQSRRLSDWIQTGEQTEEDLPSDERDTGFRLNLNNLVQFFMGEKDKPEEFFLEASSEKFRLNDLSN
jgi:hypothetical protein